MEPLWGDCSLHEQMNRGYDLGSTPEESSYQLSAAEPPAKDEQEGALPEPVPTPDVAQPETDAAKVSGPMRRKTWTAVVTNKAEFVAWALNTGQLYLLEVNQVALNTRARTEHYRLSIPGVKPVESYGHRKD